MAERREKSGDAETRDDKQITTTVTHLEAHFSGPIPPPNTLEKYEEVLPGSANRILKMAESQAQHRQNLEASVISSDIWMEKAGLGVASLLGSLILIGSIWLINIGKDIAGFAIIIGESAVFLGIFLYSRRKRQIERSHQQARLVAARKGRDALVESNENS